MQSIRPEQRIVLVDVLRGYALMGLFLIHMVEYFELYWYKPEPSAVNSFMFFLFGGKAYALFALLFGVSFFIIMDSQARKGVDFRGRFLWRLALLLAIGYLHGLIYGGDVLQILAIAGVLLVPLYGRSTAAILTISLFLVLQAPSLIVFGLANSVPGFSAGHLLDAPGILETYAHGSFLDVIRVNMWLGQLGKWSFMIESGRVSNIVGLSLLGFLLARMGFFTDIPRFQRVYVRGLITALGFSAAFMLFKQEILGLASASQSNWIFANLVSAYTNHALLTVTILGLVLLHQFRPVARILGLLAPCGRMSLTVYVSQALVCVPFFYGFGLGAYTFIGQPLSLTLGVVLWCLQVWLAHYWFKHYYYGPLEWIWRSATWLRCDIPLRRNR